MGFKVEITKGEQCPYFVEVKALKDCKYKLQNTFLGGHDMEYLLGRIIEDIKNEQ
jgi:hypothetical protein